MFYKGGNDMKKILVFTISVCLCFGMSTMVYADDSLVSYIGDTDKYIAPLFTSEANEVTVSERDMIVYLQGKTDRELKDIGYTNSEVNELREINDVEVLNEAKKCTDEELGSRGLTERQIYVIRNESDAQLAAKEVYGKVTYTINKVTYSYSSGNTVLKIKAAWKWSSRPVCTFIDSLATTTSVSDFLVTASSGTVNYRMSPSGSAKKTKSLSVHTKNSGIGAYADFSTETTFTDTTHPRPTTIFAYDGSINVSYKATKKIKSVGISTLYGHCTIAMTPSVSFDGTGGISFSTSMSYGPEAYQRLTL
jgi:hypothetical protein